ncbi:MAG TPA: FadR family transcriptional regulator [Deltaproteobacteria bacterium]|nr:FadR family transcriptional regulator [Deltaproteobacteria bacterium]
MKDILRPLRAESLKEVFITRFEELILTGKISIGQKLPPERDLALQLGVSRPVVHEGLVELAARGLVSMKPRKGTVVNDYRRQGSLAILNSLINYRSGNLEHELLEGLLQTRVLIEVETTRLASISRSEEHLDAFKKILSNEDSISCGDINAITRLDFKFHHLIGIASGNLVYPLLINSFKPVYMNFTSLFFTDKTVIPATFAFHKELVRAISAKDQLLSISIMRKILDHGERHLREILSQK